jgi:hypothetical protein
MGHEVIEDFREGVTPLGWSHARIVCEAVP